MGTPVTQDSSTGWAASLWSASQSGDERAFGLLYDLLAPSVYGLCLYITKDVATAQTAVLRTFGQLWESAPGLPSVFDDLEMSVCSFARIQAISLR